MHKLGVLKPQWQRLGQLQQKLFLLLVSKSVLKIAQQQTHLHYHFCANKLVNVASLMINIIILPPVATYVTHYFSAKKNLVNSTEAENSELVLQAHKTP